MVYIEINGTRYPATINGKMNDKEFGGRQSKTITLAMAYATASALVVDGLAWSIVMQPDAYTDPETGEEITTEAEIYDNSEFSIAGDITDHRDGTVSVKMGKPTDLEVALANAVSEEELTNAYIEGVNSL